MTRKRQFLTVPDELLEHAEALAQYFNAHGYRIRIEPNELEFPSTPTLLSRRAGTTVILEVHTRPDADRVAEWAKYGASCSSDTRVALCIPHDARYSSADFAGLKDLGAGLYIAAPAGVIEHLAPRDLSVAVKLPDIRTLPRKVQKAMGSTYEQFERGQWREAFEEACQTLEREARRYLNEGTRTGRILVVDAKGKARTLTAGQIDKLTLGQLALKFSGIQKANADDVVVAQALKRVNPDRVGVAHHKVKRSTERRLRSNVGVLFYVMIKALRVLMR